MRPALLLVVLAWSPLVSAEQCPETVKAAVVDSWLAAAEIHYTALNRVGFVESVDRASTSLPCLEEAVSGPLAARFHRVTGLRSALEGESVSARLAFAAARSIEPEFLFPEDLLPADHPFMELYLAIPIEDPARALILAPRNGYLQFDGQHGLACPQSWPTILQLFAPTGEVLSTTLLQPGSPLPEYATVEDTEPEPITALPPLEPVSQSLSRPMLAVAGSALAASAALYGASAITSNRYWDSTDAEEWDRYRTNTNRLVIASASVAVVGFGAGAWALFTVEF